MRTIATKSESPRTAMDYYRLDGPNKLGGDDARHNDDYQPLVSFSFGDQPATTRHADEGKVKCAVIGAGHVYEVFIRPTLDQRSTGRVLVDPNMPDELADSLNHHETRAKDLDDLPSDVGYILILTPPATHLDIVRKAIELGKPIVMEKPVVGNPAQLRELEELLSGDNHPPVYLIDWQIEHAKPLIAACFMRSGISVPFDDVLTIDDPHGLLPGFNLHDVVEVDARLVEGGLNPLADPEVVKLRRGWMLDFEKGGGSLYDMAVHPLNALAVMGFKQISVQDVFLGTPTKEQGFYSRFGKEPEGQPSTGELYARAHTTLSLPGNPHDIQTTIEVGKSGQENDGMIIMKDSLGRTLHWEMFPQDQKGSRVTLYDKNGDRLAGISMTADCYSLIFEHATRFVTNDYNVGQTLYLAEQASMFGACAEMHAHARAQEISENETVTQLKVLERQGRRLSLVPTNAPQPA